MFTGFQHDIAGGNGNLVVTSLQSPNFSASAGTGWQIAKDGEATFYSVSLPNVKAGTKVTFASTAPTGASNGDLWYNTSDGLELSQFEGGTWKPYQIGSGAIAPGGVAASNLDPTITARSLGGITTTISATAPTSPNDGDVWINTSAGNQLETWNGSWTPISWNASNVIEAGTITATQINAASVAAATVTAANVNALNLNAVNITGGTITGTQIVAEGASGEILAYSGTPTSGNMVASVSPVTGTDSSGNAYQNGLVAYGANKSYVSLEGAIPGTTTQPIIKLQPESVTKTEYMPQINATSDSPGTTTESTTLWLQSGQATGNTTSINPLLEMTSAPANNSANGFYEFIFASTSGVWNPRIYIEPAFTINANVTYGQDPTVTSGLSGGVWQNFNPLTSGYSVPNGGYAVYRMNADNRSITVSMHIQIAPNSGPGGSYVQLNQTLLPAGYRPLTNRFGACNGGVAALSGSNSAVPQIRLNPSGAIQLTGYASAYASAMDVYCCCVFPLD